MAITKYKQPSVRLMSDYDEVVGSWIVSRPHVSPETVDKNLLESLDLPVNGFKSYVFEVNSSLLFRDLMFTVRPINPWARSYRSVPITPDDTTLSGEYEGIDTEWTQESMNKVYEAIQHDVPQDYAKNDLPMSANTVFAVTMDDRTLLNFLNSLRIHNKELYDVYGPLFLEAIGKTEKYLDKRTMNDIYSRLAISDEEYNNVDTTHKVLDQVIGVHTVKGNLMAQFLRQHYSTVKNELWNIIDKYSFSDTELTRLTCSSELVVAMYAHIDGLKKVIQNRSCFFAQFDKSDNSSWASIIGEYVKHMKPKEFLNNLTCKGKCKNCTIRQDMLPKVLAGKTMKREDGGTTCGEVNPICPIFIERPDRVVFRKNMFNSDSEVFNKWMECYEEGLLPDNPSNPDRIEYESNVSNYGHLGFNPDEDEEPIYNEK